MSQAGILLRYPAAGAEPGERCGEGSGEGCGDRALRWAGRYRRGTFSVDSLLGYLLGVPVRLAAVVASEETNSNDHDPIDSCGSNKTAVVSILA